MQFVKNGIIHLVQPLDESGMLTIPKEYRLENRTPGAYKITMQKAGAPKIYLTPVTVEDFITARPDDATILCRADREQGRVCIPQTMRAVLGDVRAVTVSWIGSTITLKPYLPVCSFCGSTSYQAVYKDRNVCDDCIRTLYKIRFDTTVEKTGK